MAELRRTRSGSPSARGLVGSARFAKADFLPPEAQLGPAATWKRQKQLEASEQKFEPFEEAEAGGTGGH